MKEMVSVGDMDITRKHKKVTRSKEHNSNTGLSKLNNFPSKKRKCEVDNVGREYVIGDKVWGKVKTHPWWPGHVYDESLASVRIRRCKREGEILVAFYGDGTCGWFMPNELIPFEEGFNEKSRECSSDNFVQAVEEAITEVLRKRIIGLACKGKNLWPSSVEGHVDIEVSKGEYETYSLRQVKESRDRFKPDEMVSFVSQLALAPMDAQHKMIQFKKNMATTLAYRKAVYAEVDEPYAQAFGKEPVRPSGPPTAPSIVDPSKASLNGTLVTSETLGKGNSSTTPLKTEEEVNAYKWRNGPRLSKREAHSGQVQKTHEGGGVSGYKKKSTSRHPPVIVGGGKEKAKTKRLVGELSSENAGLFEKKKKMKTEIRANLVQVAVSGKSSAKGKSVLGKQVHVSLVKDTKSFSSSVKTRQVKIVEGGKKHKPPCTIKETEIKKKKERLDS